MRAGKARAVIGFRVSSTTPRCVCAFSSSCRSTQHEQQHQQRDTSAANISYYNRLFAGLGAGLDPHGASSSSSASTTPPPPQSRYLGQSSSSSSSSTATGRGAHGRTSRRSSLFANYNARQQADNTFLGPAFLRGDQGNHAATTGNGNPPSNFAQMVDRARKLDSTTRTPSSRIDQSSTVVDSRTAFGRETHLSSAPATPPPSAARVSSGVRWTDLLDKIERTREEKYSAVAPPTRQSQHVSSVPSSIHQDDVLQDRIFGSQAESRRYSQQLQEEVRELGSPAEAFKWMQNRLFSLDNEGSLMNKINSQAQSQPQELQHLYADLLVDVTHYLRNTAPQSACLPLALAKAHSPKSYLYGGTAKLYAATIRTKWEIYGDIQGCLELMQDMEKTAVPFNPQILDYVKNISMAVMVDRMRAQKQVEAELQAALPLSAQADSDDAEGSSDEAALSDVLPSAATASATPVPTEEAIEAKLYFSRTQRRALRSMEDLVVRERRRHLEQRAREDHLQDSISFQSKVGRYASPAEIQAAEEAQAGISDVNAIIDAYGKTVPRQMPRTSDTTSSHEPSNMPRKQMDRRQFAIHGETPAGTFETVEPIDVFAEAVAEVSEAPKRSRKAVGKKGTAKKPKGKKKVEAAL